LKTILIPLLLLLLIPRLSNGEVTLEDTTPFNFHDDRAFHAQTRFLTARSDCGNISTVYTVGESVFVDAVTFHEFHESADTQFLTDVLFQQVLGDVDLFYTQDCRPVVLLLDNSTWYLRTRQHDGSWDQQSGVLGIPGLDNGVYALSDLTVGADGRVYLVAHWLRFEGNGFNFRLVVLRWEETDWSLAANIEAPGGISNPFAFQADSQGRFHILTSRPSDQYEFASDFIYMRYHHGELQTRTIHAATEIDFFPTNADFSFRPDGRLEGVVTFVKTVTTGSPVYSRLNFFEEDQDGNFSMRIIAASSDAYTGSDGNKYTGSRTILHRDNTGALHLTFHDIAAWHNNSGFARSMAGQWRYGYKPLDSDWTFTTLYQQPGQSQESNPLNMLETVGFTTSPGGAHLNLVAVVNRQAFDNFPDSEIIDSRVLRLRARNSDGADQKLPSWRIIALLLGLQSAAGLAPLDHDISGDGVLDGADLRRSALP
jgi:hypothetical protein